MSVPDEDDNPIKNGAVTFASFMMFGRCAPRFTVCGLAAARRIAWRAWHGCVYLAWRTCMGYCIRADPADVSPHADCLLATASLTPPQPATVALLYL